jgi:hypothetical protein
MRVFSKAVGLAVAAGAGVLALQAPAGASPGVQATLVAKPLGGHATVAAVRPGYSGAIAYDQKTQFLTADPVSGMAASCVSRPITLKADTYDFALFVGKASVPDVRQQYIVAGTYTWESCLNPLDGYYNLDSNLWSPQAYYDISDQWIVPVDGTYTWGSWLGPW